MEKNKLKFERWQIICIAVASLAALGIIIFLTIYFKLDDIIEKNIRSVSGFLNYIYIY